MPSKTGLGSLRTAQPGAGRISDDAVVPGAGGLAFTAVPLTRVGGHAHGGAAADDDAQAVRDDGRHREGGDSRESAAADDVDELLQRRALAHLSPQVADAIARQ